LSLRGVSDEAISTEGVFGRLRLLRCARNDKRSCPVRWMHMKGNIKALAADSREMAHWQSGLIACGNSFGSDAAAGSGQEFSVMAESVPASRLVSHFESETLPRAGLPFFESQDVIS
jgi:hypothetical protein